MLGDGAVQRIMIVNLCEDDNDYKNVGHDGHEPAMIGFDGEVPFYLGEHVEFFEFPLEFGGVVVVVVVGGG